MNNVKIDITKEGWTVTVEINGETYSETYIATDSGAKRIDGNFDDIVCMSDGLRESLQGFTNHNIMRALQLMRRNFQ